jgi:hypothetical protein
MQRAHCVSLIQWDNIYKGEISYLLYYYAPLHFLGVSVYEPQFKKKVYKPLFNRFDLIMGLDMDHIRPD